MNPEQLEILWHVCEVFVEVLTIASFFWGFGVKLIRKMHDEFVPRSEYDLREKGSDGVHERLLNAVERQTDSMKRSFDRLDALDKKQAEIGERVSTLEGINAGRKT